MPYPQLATPTAAIILIGKKAPVYLAIMLQPLWQHAPIYLANTLWLIAIWTIASNSLISNGF
jgi:hypothetical protein